MDNFNQTNNKALPNKTQTKPKTVKTSNSTRTNLNITILNIRTSKELVESRISIRWVMETSFNQEAARFLTVNISTNTLTPARALENEHLVEYRRAKPFQTFKLVNVSQVSNTLPLNRFTSKIITI